MKNRTNYRSRSNPAHATSKAAKLNDLPKHTSPTHPRNPNAGYDLTSAIRDTTTDQHATQTEPLLLRVMGFRW